MIYYKFKIEIMALYAALDRIIVNIEPSDDSDLDSSSHEILSQCREVKIFIENTYKKLPTLQNEVFVSNPDDMMQFLAVVLPLVRRFDEKLFDSYFPLELFSE